MFCRMMKDFLCKPVSGCCTNDLNQFAMATPRGATESVWIVCFGNKRVQTNQVNAKSFKMIPFLLLKFPKSKQTRQKANWSRKWTQQARSSIFIVCIGSRVWTALSLPNRKINWFLKTASAFWPLRQQTVVTEAATGESSVLRLLCDSLC